MFVRFFIFYLSHLEIPLGRFSESFVKIRLDLAEILLILNCLFVCLFVCLLFLFE